MTNQKLSALQTTVLVLVAMFMVAKSVVSLYGMIARLALRLGRLARTWYTGSQFQTPVVDDLLESTIVESTDIKKALGNYICGVCLVASVVHGSYIYLRRLDYVESVKLETKVSRFTVDIWENYATEWRKVLA